MSLPYEVRRSIVIDAEREIVFSFFTDPGRWAAWWGAGSTVEPRVGGAIRIRHSNGFESVGNVLEIAPPERFAFSFSMQAAKPVPPEDSHVHLSLETRGRSTMVTVRHEFADAALRELMPQGWRFHLSLFSNAVANLIYADAAEIVDRWFALWSLPDPTARAAGLRAIAHEDLRFHDRYSALDGVEDVVAQLGAVQRFMPGLRFERRGDVRHCQGTAVIDWAAVSADGKEPIAGTNVFTFVARRIAAVTGVTK